MGSRKAVRRRKNVTSPRFQDPIGELEMEVNVVGVEMLEKLVAEKGVGDPGR